MRLRLLATVRIEQLRRDFAAEHDDLLVLCRIALLRLVDLADDVVLQELCKQVIELFLPLGQGPSELRFLLWALAQQHIVDGAAARHREHHVVRLALVRLVAHGDAQAALARHEEPHDLRQRAKVEVREPARNLDHLRREPALLVDRRDDVLECDVLRGCRELMRLDDKALDLAAAEWYEDAPTRLNLRELLRHAVRIGPRNALDGNIHENIGCLHRSLFILSQTVSLYYSRSPSRGQKATRPPARYRCAGRWPRRCAEGRALRRLPPHPQGSRGRQSCARP